jgi:hypothetical protein
MSLGHIFVTHPDGYRQALPLGGDVLRIGSAADNDIVLEGAQIAPYHATIGYAEQDDLLIRLTVGGMGGALEFELPRSFAPAMLLRIGGYVLSYKPASRRSTRPIEAIQEPLAERAVGGESALLHMLLDQDSTERAGGDPHDAVTMELPALPLLDSYD